MVVARRSSARRWGRRLGLALIAVGLVLVLYWASDFLAAGWRQGQDQARWLQLTAGPVQGSAAELARPVDGIDFRLRVPKLGYSAVVREGVGLNVLASGPGHYPTSAWPGQSGTVGVAAHNVFWIQFDQLQPGDQLILETRYGTFNYRMTGSRIVSPSDTSVLTPQQDRQLTLTTCWPLWAGQVAQQRLAIFAATA
jgi:sortase A